MKKFFKIVWKSLLGIAAVAVVFLGVILGYACYDNYTSYCNVAYLSNNVTVRYYYNQREHKVYNRQLDKITLKGLDKAVEPVEGDSLTVFFKDGVRGFLNANTGYVVIPAQYKKAWVFSEGLAAVVNESGKIGFINKDNEVVLPFVYDCRREYPIDYVFRNGLCVMTDERGACGVIDKEGNWVMEPQYDCIWNLYFDKYRIVKEGEKYGMIDENMKLVFPVEYDAIEFAESERDGVLLTKDYVTQHVAFDGRVIDLFVVDDVEDLHYTQAMGPMIVDDGYGNESLKTEKRVLADYVRYRANGLYGVMHRETGKVIIPPMYNEVEMVSPRLIKARINELWDYVLYDTEGRKVDGRGE